MSQSVDQSSSETNTQKRSRNENPIKVVPISTVLLDIEGTTTSISFVIDDLFPYVRNNVEKYLNTHWETEETQEDLKLLRELSVEDNKNRVDGAVLIPSEGEASKSEILKAVVKNVLWQMDGDRKSKPLKSLQGHMFPEAYESGTIRGHVYPDVIPCIEKWKKAGTRMNIYSSGSILAQKLLFKYSEFGDLTPNFTKHFDTTTGSKLEAKSYEIIADQLLKDIKESDPSNNNQSETQNSKENTENFDDQKKDRKKILFITDNYLEAVAASESGLSVCLSVRPGTKELPKDNQYPVINSFEELWSTKENLLIRFTFQS